MLVLLLACLAMGGGASCGFGMDAFDVSLHETAVRQIQGS